jgi:hypothetical protein
MGKFVALFLTAFTLPLWGGAAAAVIATGTYLLVQNPLLFVAICVAIFFFAPR